MDKLPEFKGRPLVETPGAQMIGYLEGEFGKAFLEKYNTVIDEKYNGNKKLKVLEFGDNVVKGSSTYSSVIAADMLRKGGLEIAKPVDIEFSIKLYNKTNGRSGLDIKKQCSIDYGVVFRNAADPNKYHAEKLESQIKRSLDIKKIKYPIVILSGDLDIVNDENGPNGLGFSLKNESKPFAASALKHYTSFTKTDRNGMPVPKERKGGFVGIPRTSYADNDSGLSRMCLYQDMNFDLCSSLPNLTQSNPDGRVVAVKK